MAIQAKRNSDVLGLIRSKVAFIEEQTKSNFRSYHLGLGAIF